MPDDQGTSELDPEIEPVLERTPTVLLLDTSGSMGNETETPDGDRKPKIAQLNEGLATFEEEMQAQEHANKRVDVALVTFGGTATVQQDFTPIRDWQPPQLEDGGTTPMGAAIERAIDLVEDRKEMYHREGIPYNRPFLWLLTDGMPTDMDEGDQDWIAVQDQLRDGVENNHFLFFAMGVSGADMGTLNALVSEPTDRPALELKEGMFTEFFRFVSNSMEQVSDPTSGDSVELDQDHLETFAQFAQVD